MRQTSFSPYLQPLPFLDSPFSETAIFPQVPGEERLNQSGAGARGTIGRGTEASRLQPANVQPTAPSPSRAEQIGEGARGTDGRVIRDQQPAAYAAAGRGARGVERREAQEISGADQKPVRHPAHVAFAEGLEFTSDDQEFSLQFHNLTQVDFRGFPKADQGVLQSQFFIPRQRWYFTGDLTNLVGFYTVIERGYNSLDLLDAFISLRIDTRFNLRIGRMKTPYLYEYYSIAEGDLIAPERSVYASNLGLNRQIGAMALGTFFEDRASYAVGVYNGPRRSFGDFKSSKDLIGYFNFRPFLLNESMPAFKYLNIGGSFDAGYQDNPTAQPTYFETANDQTSGTGATSVSPTFLVLNKNVTELGQRVEWAAHMAWYYKSFLLLSEYGGTRAGYSTTNSATSTPVNFEGFMVQASYFITGEQMTRRVNVVKPRRDFTFDFLKGGAFNPGAIELHARFAQLNIGNNVFTAGFADPNQWTNNVWVTDIGANWYLNFYTRVFLDWQHAEFGNPVQLGGNKFGSTTDIYWLRFQVFF